MDNDKAVKRLEKLRSELADLTSQAAVAQANADRVTSELGPLLARLKDYGCTSYEEASSLLETMKKDLEKKFREAEDEIHALRGN